MSKTKAIQIYDHVAWTYCDSHDLAVGTMVEVASRRVQEPWLLDAIYDWRDWASIPDLGFELPKEMDDEKHSIIREILIEAVNHVESRNDDYRDDEVSRWALIPDMSIAGGGLRNGVTVPRAAVIDVLSGFIECMDNELPKLPDRTWWFFGGFDGRCQITGSGSG